MIVDNKPATGWKKNIPIGNRKKDKLNMDPESRRYRRLHVDKLHAPEISDTTKENLASHQSLADNMLNVEPTALAQNNDLLQKIIVNSSCISKNDVIVT